MDGRVLTEIISEEYLKAHSIQYAAGSGDDQTGGVEFSAEENAEIIESLKNLGYIG
jgi:dolichyl-phosphate-mannose--protein O-mannosyl transferase